jgi:PAS domain S-box-containing protein
MAKPVIDAHEAVALIRAGLDDAALMQEFGISAHGLQSLFKKLIASGLLSGDEIKSRFPALNEGVNLDMPSDSANLAELAGSRILALTDDLDAIAMVNEFAAGANIEVANCGDGFLGANLCAYIKPQLIVIDSVLCDEEVRSALKKSCDAVTVVIHDNDNRERIGEFFQHGAFNVLERPLEQTVLNYALKWALKYKALEGRTADEDPTLTETRRIPADAAKNAKSLHGILESSTMISVVLCDLDQTVTFWNKGAENIFGYTAAEMVGQKITKLYPPHKLTQESAYKLHKQTVESTKTIRGRMKQLTKNRQFVTISLSLAPVIDSTGKVTGTIGIGLDISEEVRKNAELIKGIRQDKAGSAGA